MTVGTCQYFPPPLGADAGLCRERAPLLALHPCRTLRFVVRAERGGSALVEHGRGDPLRRPFARGRQGRAISAGANNCFLNIGIQLECPLPSEIPRCPFPPAVRPRVRAIAGSAGGVFAEAKQKHGQPIEKARYGEIAGSAAIAFERQIAGETKLFVSPSLRFVSPRFASPRREGRRDARPVANAPLGPLGLVPRTAGRLAVHPASACRLPRFGFCFNQSID